MPDETTPSARSQGFRTLKWAADTPNEKPLYQCSGCSWDTFDADEMDVHVAWHRAGSPRAVASR